MALGPYFFRRISNVDLKIIKISGHPQRWPRPLTGAILIPPALRVVADFYADSKEDVLMIMKDLAKVEPLRHEGTKKRRINEYKTWNQWFW